MVQLGLIFVNAAVWIGAPTALFYPYIGLLIYVGLAIIQPTSMWYWIPLGGPLTLAMEHGSRIVAISMIVGWISQGMGHWNFGRGRRVVLMLLGFMAWALVSTVYGYDSEPGWRFLDAMSKIVLPFMVGMTLMNSSARLKQLAWVIALSQGYVAYELNVSYYSGYNRIVVIGFGGMDNNFVAVAMVTGAALAFFLGLNERRIPAQILAFLACVLQVHAVMFSFSRGGMLGLICTTIFAFFLVPKKPKHYVIFLLIIMLGFRLAGPEVRQRFSSVFVDPEERDRSASSRVEFWGYCWTTMKEHPIMGVGPNYWPTYVGRFRDSGVTAHSLWMQTGAEMGFPGLALLLGFYGLCCLALWPLARRRIRTHDPWIPDAACMTISALAGFAVAASFVTISGLELSYYITMLGAGALKLSSDRNMVLDPISSEPLPDMATER